MVTSAVRQSILPGLSKDTRKTVPVAPATPYRLGEGVLIGTEWKITADPMNVIVWRKEGKTSHAGERKGTSVLSVTPLFSLSIRASGTPSLRVSRLLSKRLRN